MASALLINAGVSYYGISFMSRSLDDVYFGGALDMQQLVSIRSGLMQAERVPNKILTKRIGWAEGAENLKDAIASIDENWTNYLADIHKEQDQNKPSELIERIQRQIKDRKPNIERLQEIIKSRDHEALLAFEEKQDSLALESLNKEIFDLINWHAKDTQKDYQEAINEAYKLEMIIVLISFVLLLIAITAAIWIALSITRPLQGALENINKLTVGDLSLDNVHFSKDEIGQLLGAMKSLVASSQKMSNILTDVSKGDLTINVQQRSDQDTLGAALADMVKNLRHIVGELQSETATLSSSSQEIVESVSQVASGSVETAAAVTETTTSVEELKQTAHISDEKAKDVLTSAEETLQVVNASEKSLQTTIEDMRQINEKMHIISTGIVKLSENSQTIREIIDTVNDLAEQSNLLAVNAAIEAAKAGEHGKSFGVVAQEIRTLAEQSKAATIQVRSILNDIQNSTSEAVLATEQGSKAVEKGVNQSMQTSEFMQKLTQSMTRVMQAANQIVITSQQQLIGIDQVTVAMNNINEASTQHVEHMKQIETAVSSMNSVGEILKDLINKYRLVNEDESRTFRMKK